MVSAGLSAGVCEEVSRYVVYHFWLPRSDYHSKAAVSFGAGHGGCEALLVGIFLLVTLIYCTILRHQDLDKLFPPEKVPDMRKMLSDYWGAPWYEVLMAPMERITAMTFHMSAAVLVLQIFRRHSFAWLGAAIAFHTLIDTLAVVAISEAWNKVAFEVILGLLTFPLAAWILVALADDTNTGGEYMPLLPPSEEVTTDESPVPPRDEVTSNNQEQVVGQEENSTESESNQLQLEEGRVDDVETEARGVV